MSSNFVTSTVLTKHFSEFISFNALSEASLSMSKIITVAPGYNPYFQAAELAEANPVGVKTYIDNSIEGLDIHEAVQLATTEDLLTSTVYTYNKRFRQFSVK